MLYFVLGKGWILQHATSHDAGKVISQHLLRKVTQPGAPFSQKLHIIYLVNDVLHHWLVHILYFLIVII